jgi:1,4-alpha-glucan branching enzyme
MDAQARILPPGSGPDLLLLRRRQFLLWRPARVHPPPRLVIGRFAGGVLPELADEHTFELAQFDDVADLWGIDAASCDLSDGSVYHYWFEVTDSRPGGPGGRLLVTDPLASTVDWRLLSPLPPVPYGEADRWPAAVIGWSDGELTPCDPDGSGPDWSGDAPIAGLPANNRCVYYKLPTRWAARAAEGGIEVGTGTFRDVLALVQPDVGPVNVRGTAALRVGTAHLRDLGVNALELLPIADSWVVREWGYATSNYFAPDHDLGFPRGFGAPRPNQDLSILVAACHRAGMRFGYDAVMAFGQHDPYRQVNFLDFHVLWGAGDPEQGSRDGFGGDLFKYNFVTEGYDPVDGKVQRIVPARQFMQSHIARWVLDQRIDSIRVDSVNNVGNDDFVAAFTAYARGLFRERAAAQGVSAAAADARFLVAGEELSVPVRLVREGRLDALWNERFKHLLRCAIVGRNHEDFPSFEQTVRNMVDCRRLGFTDGAQAVNYVTSHDVEGYRNERLYNYLRACGVWRTEERVKLAFVCLLTAVGIPLILAGEEFADEHDLPVAHPYKQVDPVNFDRLEDPWRRRIFEYVARLVRLRQEAPALGTNDVDFIHVDFTPGRRVVAWRRGGPADDPVVVVANFSAWGSEPSAEYIVPNWPVVPAGRTWREVTQDRPVPPEWVGREPLYPWEAKVYTLA